MFTTALYASHHGRPGFDHTPYKQHNFNVRGANSVKVPFCRLSRLRSASLCWPCIFLMIRPTYPKVMCNLENLPFFKPTRLGYLIFAPFDYTLYIKLHLGSPVITGLMSGRLATTNRCNYGC